LGVCICGGERPADLIMVIRLDLFGGEGRLEPIWKGASGRR
jgi:hypothetical protein